MAEARQERRYVYPWDSVEEELERHGHTTLPLVGYGSLVNLASATLTLRDSSPELREPVIAFGVRRLFNCEMELDGGRYGPPINPLARAALNVRFTDEMRDAINGVLVPTSIKDIGPLRTREVGYDLMPVACLRWVLRGQPPFVAYILSCPDQPQGGRKRTHDNLEPHREYYRICRKGAAKLGVEFLRFWLATTYLADGVTPVGQWEAREVPDSGEMI